MKLLIYHLREDGMTPYEIMLSESQERMVFVVHPEDVEELMNVFKNMNSLQQW